MGTSLTFFGLAVDRYLALTLVVVLVLVAPSLHLPEQPELLLLHAVGSFNRREAHARHIIGFGIEVQNVFLDHFIQMLVH